LISPEDFNLFRITHDVEDAVSEVLKFYHNFHSYRWVGPQLVIRLQEQLTPDAIAHLNASFSDLFETAPIRASGALKQEKNEPELFRLPRLVATPHRRNFGRLRALIDAVNEAEIVAVPGGGE
jgi:hypothetical protein